MVQVIPVILTFHTYGTGISAGIISDLYRDHICSAGCGRLVIGLIYEKALDAQKTLSFIWSSRKLKVFTPT